MDFSKNFSKVTDSGSSLEPKFEIFILLFGLIFLKISSQILRFLQKLRVSYFSFGLVVKRISSQKKASLASTVPKPSMR